jgi:hypothetical protein
MKNEELVHLRLPATILRALRQTARVESANRESDLSVSDIVEEALKHSKK